MSIYKFDSTITAPAPCEAYEGNRPFIFLSYCHANASVVYPAIKMLSDQGFRIWYDKGLLVSGGIVSDIVRHINHCGVFVIFLSKESVKSESVLKEIHYASDLRGKQRREDRPMLSIIPVLLDDCMTDELSFTLNTNDNLFVDFTHHPDVQSRDFTSALQQYVVARLAASLSAEYKFDDPVSKTDRSRPVIEEDVDKTGTRSGSSVSGNGVLSLGRQTFTCDAIALDFSGEGITDISVLSQMTNLRELNLWGNNVTDLSPLANLTSLRKLTLSRNSGLSDISPIAGLTRLELLDLSGCSKIKDITPISGMTALTKLLLPELVLTDGSCLSGLVNLTVLDLRGSKLKDISFMQHMTKMQSLNLYHNDVVDISVLGNMYALESLDLFFNDVVDISPLANLRMLQTIDLERCKVSDISPLLGLPSLKRVDISHTRVSAADKERLESALPNTRVIFRN